MTFDLTTIITIITGVINLTLLGFLIHFFKTFREIAHEREQLIKEQKNLSDTKTQVVEKELAYTDRQNKQLIAEKEQLQRQLAETLNSGGIDLNFILNNSLLKDMTSNFTEKVENLTKKLEEIQNGTKDNKIEIFDGDYHMTLGKGFVVNRNWKKAAYHLDLAALSFPDDWNLHFTRGISYANIRGDNNTNIKSIEAYTQAIMYLPDSEQQYKSKIYIYRGAIFKRIGKIDEAEIDVKYGLSNTEDDFLIADAKYNLACIYAMRGDREKLFDALKDLRKMNIFKPGLRHHLNDYFAKFKNDREFLSLIS